MILQHMVNEPPTILVVDDDPSVRTSVARLLRSAGYVVETCWSAEEFLQTESERPKPGCIVLDIQMPGLNGLDFQEQLVARDDALPIVFITGYGDHQTELRAMKHGAVGFLTKPFDDDELLRAVRDALEQDSRPDN